MIKVQNAIRGEWRMARVIETYPDEHGVARNVKLISPPPGLDGSRDYRSPAMSELERHVSNLVVIVPNDDDIDDVTNDDDLGIGGSVETSQTALSQS